MTTIATIATLGVRAVIVTALLLVIIIAVGRLETLVTFVARLWFDREEH
ncbi:MULTISPECIES: hypothetical protein [Sphingomonas]|nr:hypothetical protein [Sphingomonas sp. CCH10-B3]